MLLRDAVEGAAAGQDFGLVSRLSAKFGAVLQQLQRTPYGGLPFGEGVHHLQLAMIAVQALEVQAIGAANGIRQTGGGRVAGRDCGP